MDKHQVGKIASAVVAAAGPALAGYAASAVKNRLLNGGSQPKAPQKQQSRARYEQVVRNAPVALSQYQPKVGFKSAAPVTKGASARITGCDYVGALSSTGGAFSDQAFRVTPLNNGLFTRLWAMATVFELYKFLKIRPILVGKAASSQAGSMTLAPDLYPDSDAFTAAEMRNEEGQSTTKTWEVCAMDYPCARGTRVWFLTDNANTANATDSDLGELHVGCDSLGAGAVVFADLFIEYDIEFAQAQVSGGVSLLSPMLRRLLAYEGGLEALLATAHRLLPEEERRKYNKDGSPKPVPKLQLHSDALDEFKRDGVLPAVDVCPKPIPAAAMSSLRFRAPAS
jgi:hypothetical protein